MKKVYIFEQGCYAVLKDTPISFVFEYLLDIRAKIVLFKIHRAIF